MTTSTKNENLCSTSLIYAKATSQFHLSDMNTMNFEIIRKFIWAVLFACFLWASWGTFNKLLNPGVGITYDVEDGALFPSISLCFNQDPGGFFTFPTEFADLENLSPVRDFVDVFVKVYSIKKG